MEYNFTKIEQDWQQYWAKNKTFKAEEKSNKPKYYVLDMFPYPSGAGLHVGHPLGYIASDIYARYKRLKGFNVLHPMGYDSFGLPAEQYAIQTGQHPAITTQENIARYRQQLDKIGFSFDWDREVRTSNPNYYKWTQWIFIQLFNSWYNPETDKAEKIDSLIDKFKQKILPFAEDLKGAEWNSLSEKEQQAILMNYRLAYLSEAWVNWCPALGTVLANDEIKDGVSERGGHPVERKLMKQWSMRITAYAQRLLNGLETIDWTESIKEAQRNWIGRSVGTSLKFKIAPSNSPKRGELSSADSSLGEASIDVFTTRPDTIFGVSFVTLAPEHELVTKLTTPENKKAVDEYVTLSKNRSERERQADVKKISGQFTGSYVLHPFTNEQIPIWIGDYVLASYGTGAVMAVPAHDTRDYAFAKHFNLPIKEVVQAPSLLEKAGDEASYDAKEGTLINSDFLNGLQVKEAMKKAIATIEEKELGKGKINYRLRDAVFGRQRYWGEPIPVYFEDGIAKVLSEDKLPLILPEVDKYLPTEDGEPPLARAKDWSYEPLSNSPQKGEDLGGAPYETTTMPGWAGSSWYFYRYMDSNNANEFASQESINYWQDVDLYIGGSEHATGHLLYARFWNKFLFDLGLVPKEEPFKKLINQGMIQGESAFTHRLGLVLFEALKPNLKFEINSESVAQYSFGSSFVLSKSIADNLTNEDSDTEQMIKEKLDAQYKKHHPDFTDNVLGVDYEINFLANPNERIVKRHVHVDFVNGKNELDIKNTQGDSMGEFNSVEFLLEKDGNFICSREVEKMSKSKWNVVTPDLVCEKFGADTLRLYEMFLGPLELSKPWSTNGITGVHGFLKKLWRLFYGSGEFAVTNEEPTKAELKTLHKTIKKITEDIERFSFNTSVSNFMICVNELTDVKCNKRSILEPLLIILSPYAPHIAEELWKQLGNKESITFANFPMYDEAYLVDDTINYPVSFNGKTRFMLELAATMNAKEIEEHVMTLPDTQKYLEGKTPKKVIIVPKKIVNIVV